MPKVGVKKAKANPVAPKKATSNSDRDVLYGKVSMSLCLGEKSLTAAKARDLLGWYEVDGDGYDFLDTHDKGIKCSNNQTNRPLSRQVIARLTQEILRRRWKFNGEPLIIGNTGMILNGQHTLISLVLAAQMWLAERDKWHMWDTEPTIEKAVVFGIGEDDDTVNTMDTCKPRLLSDVFYRSEMFKTGIFEGYKSHERRLVSRMCDHAVRILWDRTGAGVDAYSLKRTHAESLYFVSNHPKVLECVKFIYELDTGKGAIDDKRKRKVARYLPPGYSSGMLYLMGCSETNPDEYLKSEHRHEGLLGWKSWDAACEFWTLLASDSEEIKPVLKVIMGMIGEDGASKAERLYVISKAWAKFAAGNKITEENVAPEYVEDDEGYKKLADCPVVGGIDLGEPSEDDMLAMSYGVKTVETVEVGSRVTVDYEGSTWEGEVTDAGPGYVHVKDSDDEIFEIPTRNVTVV